MIVMGKARTITPQKAAKIPIILPGTVNGNMSPYPTDVSVCTHQYQPIKLEEKVVGDESTLYLSRSGMAS